jgi:hypothetical protein
MDPFAACQQLIRDIPSRSGVTALGTVAGVVNKSSTTRPPVLALAFVHAAARQLPAVANQFQRDKALAKLVAEVCDVSCCCCCCLHWCSSEHYQCKLKNHPSPIRIYYLLPDLECLSDTMHVPTSDGIQLGIDFVEYAQ